MKWLTQLVCKHILTSQYPVEDPEIWGWVYTCGICGHRKDVTKDVLLGRIKTSD